MLCVRALKFLLLLLLVAGRGLSAEAASKIVKVLPQYLDGEGRHALSPSLYDRDAYQLQLRRLPEDRAGVRFAIQWKGPRAAQLILRVEMRGARGKVTTKAVLEQPVQRRGWFSEWSSLKLVGAEYQDFGDLVAWRATLWNGAAQVGLQTSFLW